MYLTQLLYLLSWPVMTLLSYWLINVYLRKLNKKLAEDSEAN